jgi:hypothetical protein
MAKMLNVFKDIFLTEKENVNEESLKVIYDIDIFVKNTQEQEQEEPVQDSQEVEQQNTTQLQQQTQPAPVQPELQQPVASVKTEGFSILRRILKEDDADFTQKVKGEMKVSKSEVENIQTFEDLLDFVADHKDSYGNPILGEVAVELILTLIGSNAQANISDIIKKDDKVLIDISYGSKISESVGFKLLKRVGVSSVSIMMKKNNHILDTPFNLKMMNSQILLFRNEMVEH